MAGLLPSNPVVQRDVCLRRFTTLRAGGLADELAVARNLDELVSLAKHSHDRGESLTILGWGSNVLPSDQGVRGLTVINQCENIRIGANGLVLAETGCGFQNLFLKSAQAGLRGLEFAVGIPGSLGGALVSNAGAYRSSIAEFLIELEVVVEGKRQWVNPAWMEFSYRDSRLRKSNASSIVLLQVKMQLPIGVPKLIYDEAREYQRQRIGKQPPSPSAGSFFKNVTDKVLAENLPSLPSPLKAKGIVPAGYLIEACGLKGARVGGAVLARRHANFILNVGRASATDIRQLASLAKRTVRDRFGVMLEEEVLYLGDWAEFNEDN